MLELEVNLHSIEDVTTIVESQDDHDVVGSTPIIVSTDVNLLLTYAF